MTDLCPSQNAGGDEAAVGDFYDKLTPLYDLIFEDWDASIRRQSAQLSQLIKSEWPGSYSVLDVSCGIGTQAIALALAGYRVCASDIAGAAVARARKEAAARNADVAFSVCDMRNVSSHHDSQFDVVVSVDNSLPHLLSDDEIGVALSQFHACLQPGGGCLITVRDYDREPRGSNIVKPYGERVRGSKRYSLSQVWDFDSEHYDLTMRITEEDTTTRATREHVFHSRYYALSVSKLCRLMIDAGFVRVHRVDDAFYQPVLLGTKPGSRPLASGVTAA